MLNSFERFPQTCSIVITQAEGTKITQEIFNFADYRTAQGLINVLQNLNPDFFDHSRKVIDLEKEGAENG